MKKVLFVLLIGVFAFAVYWSYQRFNSQEGISVHPLKAIPAEAAVVLESDDFSSFWNHFSETNIAWHALKADSQFKTVDSLLTEFNLQLETLPQLDERLNSTPICWAIFGNGDGSTDHLLAANLGSPKIYADWNSMLEKMGFSRAGKSNHETIEISEWQKEGTKYYASLNSELLHFSNSLTIIQGSISKSKKPDLPSTLTQVYETSSKNQKLKVLIQPSQLPKLLATNLSPNATKWFLEKGKVAGWSELDFSAEANSFNLFGFSSIDSSQYLGGLDAIPAYNECLKGIPNYTSALKWWGFSNYKTFVNSKAYSDSKRNEILTMGGVLDKDLVSHLGSWLDNQFATFTIGENEKAIICRHNGSHEPKAMLVDYCISDSVIANHLEVPIFKLQDEFKAGMLFKETANFNFVFATGEFVYFTKTLTSAKRIIGSSIARQVLSEDEGFGEFYSNKFSEKSNFFYYCNSPFSSNGLLPYLSPELKARINKNETSFSGFTRFGWQMSSNDHDMVYHNISVGHSSGQTELIASNNLWELQVDTLITKAPQLLKNHRTTTEEALIQDAGNNIYLISSAGNIKWKKQVDGQIMGKIKQIDVFGNGKYQMLFNTKNRIYLVDINGNHVKGFPVNLPAFATTELTVLDYDNNHNYRILVGTDGGKVLNYDKAGQIVTGWSFAGSASNIASSPIHSVIANKDYIHFYDESGKIHVVDRRGNTRHDVKKNLPIGFNGASYIKGRSIGTCSYVYADSSNTLKSLSFDGIERTLLVDSTGSYQYLGSIDYANDGFPDQLIRNGKNLEIYGMDMSLLKFVELSDKGTVGYTTAASSNLFYHLYNGEIFFFDEYGDPLPDYPENSDFDPTISDMNKDGKIDLITVSGRTLKAKILH